MTADLIVETTEVRITVPGRVDIVIRNNGLLARVSFYDGHKWTEVAEASSQTLDMMAQAFARAAKVLGEQR